MYLQLITLLKKRESIFQRMETKILKCKDTVFLPELKILMKYTRINIFAIQNRWKADDIEYLYEAYQLKAKCPVGKTTFILNLFEQLRERYFVDVYNSEIQTFVNCLILKD